MKRVLALLLSLSMVLTLAPVTGFADEAADQPSVNIIEDEHDHVSEPSSDAVVETTYVSASDESNSTIKETTGADDTELWSSATSLPTAGSYKLLRDVHLSSQLIPTGDLTIDLNGFTIYDERTSGSWGTIRLVNAAGEAGYTVTLKNGNFDGTKAEKNCFVYSRSLGDAISLNIDGVAFANFANIVSDNSLKADGKTRLNDTTSGRVLSIQGKTNIIVTDSIFADSACENLGTIYLGSTGTQSFDGCTFKNLSAAGYTTAIVDSEEVTTEPGQAGAIQISKPATLSDCTFENCSATGIGGAVYASASSEITDCYFEGCSGTMGGAIYVAANSTITDCEFYQCQATTGGGGAVYYVAAASSPSHTATNCLFASNSAKTNGGAVTLGGSTTTSTSVTFDTCTFYGNTTEENASAIVTATASFVTLKDCEVTENISAAKSGVQYAGAVYNYNAANYTIVGSTVIKDNYDVNGNPADFLLQGTSSIFTLVNPTADTYLNIKVATTANADRTLGTLSEGSLLGTYSASYQNKTSVKKASVSLNETNIVTSAFTDAHVHKNSKGEEVTYIPWTDSTKLPSEGNYFLTCDVHTTAVDQLTGDLNLCLNGHVIDRAKGSFWILQVRGNTDGKKADAILNIDDCTGCGGFEGNGASVDSPFIGSSQEGCAGEINCSNIFFRNAVGTGDGAPGTCIQYDTACTLTNCTFENLTTSGNGSIMFVSGSATRKFVDCSFIDCNTTTAGKGNITSTAVQIINDGVTYSAWNKNNSLPIAGTYALSGPVSAGSTRLDVADALTIDLNGQTIKRTAAVGMYNVSATDVLTITSSKEGACLDGAGISSGSALLMTQSAAAAGSEMNLSNFTIKNIAGTANGATITWQSSVAANIKDVTVENCVNTGGNNSSVLFDGCKGTVVIDGLNMSNSGVLYSDGNSTVKNSRFENCSSNYDGGAIITGANTTIQNCEFIGNYAKTSGGAIKVNGATTITESIFSGNNSASGGAVNNGSAAAVTIDDCEFTGNYATNNGGAVYVTNGKFTITDTKFTGNGLDIAGTTTTANGGAIYVHCSVTPGSKTAGGGKLNAAQGSADVTNCTFDGNKAKTSAGAVYLGAPMNWTSGTTNYTNDATTFTGCTFENNYAGTYGGAIRVGHSGSYYSAADVSTAYNTDAKAIITDSTFTNNSCPGNAGGGAVKIYNYATCEVSNTTFIGNNGKAGSAISLNANGNFVAEDSTFTGNIDAGTGTTPYAGAVYVANGSQHVTLTGATVVAENYTASDVPANIGLQDATAYVTIVNPTADTELTFNTIKARTGADKLGALQVEEGKEEAAAAATYTYTTKEDAALVVNSDNDLVTAHSHDGITFLPWTDATKLPTSGNYCLETDVELAAGDYVRDDLNLCLNGHTVTYTKGSWFVSISTVRTGSQRLDAAPTANVFVCNCSEEGGFDGNNVKIGGPVVGSTEYNKTGEALAGSFTFKNVAFKNLVSTSEGAAFQLQGSTTLSLDGCTFENISAVNEGGAVDVIGKNNTTITNCSFENCSVAKNSSNANGYGGAVYISSSAGECHITDTTFTECKGYAGAAIYACGTTQTYLENVSFINNKDLQTGQYAAAYYTISKAADTHLKGLVTFINNYNSAATPLLVGLNIQNAEGRLVIEDLDADSVIPLLSGGKAAADFASLGTITGDYNNNIFWSEDESKFIAVEDGELKFATASTHIHDDITYEAWTETTSLPSSGNYFLTKDVTLTCTTKKVQAIVTGELNLCLNGHTISYDASGAAITSSDTADTAVYGAIRVNGSGKCNLTNCREGFGGFDASKGAATTEGQAGLTAILFTNAATTADAQFNVSNIKFFGLNNASARAVVFQGLETSSFTNCTFENNTANASGAAIYATGFGKMTIDGCTFKNNIAKAASSVYRTQKTDGEYHGEFILTNNVFTDNAANGEGTGVGAATISIGIAKMTVSNNTFEGNTGVLGAALRITGSNAENLISENVFKSNTSTSVTIEETTTTGRGAALYVSAATTATITKNIFEGNKAVSSAAGIYLNADSNVTISENEFTNNTLTAAKDAFGADIFVGGAAPADAFGVVTIKDNTFAGAAYTAPAVYVGPCNDGVTITGTTTTTRAGEDAIYYVAERAAVDVDQATFTGFDGKAAINALGTLNVNDTTSDGTFYMDASANMYGIQMDGMAVVSGDTVAAFELTKHTGSTYELGGGEAEKAIISIQGKNLGDAAELTVAIPEGDDINDYVFGPAVIESTTTADTYKVTAAFVEPGINVPVTDGEYSYNIVSASLDITDKLALNFQYESTDPDAYMSFFLDGKELADYDKAKTAENTYTMLGLSPRAMTLPIKAVLYSGEGTEEYVIDDYSVVMYIDGLYKNVEKFDDAKSEATKGLLANLLNYGQASQIAQNFNLKSLPLTGRDWAASYITAAAKPSSIAAQTYKVDNNTSKTKGAGPKFAEALSLYFNVEAKNDSTEIIISYSDGDYTDDSTFTVWKEGTVAELETELGMNFERTAKGCRIFTDTIAYNQLDRVFRITVKDNGLAQQTIIYSLNSYICSKWNNLESGDMLKALEGFANAIDAYIAESIIIF